MVGDELKPKTPFGTVPILEVDGKTLGGSIPIAVFLAQRHGLAGANDFENAEIAGIMDFRAGNLGHVHGERRGPQGRDQ